MYRIDYIVGSRRMNVYTPFDDTYSIASGVYHRETNTIGKLTFSVLHDHPYRRVFEKYKGVIELYYGSALLYKFRITGVRRNLFNTVNVTCEGLLGYLNDSIVSPYVFNENSWLYPITPSDTHNCTPVEFLRELIALHNTQVTEAQRFEFVDETNGAFDDTKFTTSQNSYPKAWDELESKVLRNIGGYVQIRFRDSGNQFVYKAALTERNTQTVRYAVNLKTLELDNGSQEFATAIYPTSTYTDSTGKSQTIDIYEVNNSSYTVQNNAAVQTYGKIVKHVPYEGIVSPERLKWFAERDINQYVTNGAAISLSATDMCVIEPQNYQPLEVDKNTDLISTVNEVRTTVILNAFDVDLLNPKNSRYTFNGEVPSFARRAYTYKR